MRGELVHLFGNSRRGIKRNIVFQIHEMVFIYSFTNVIVYEYWKRWNFYLDAGCRTLEFYSVGFIWWRPVCDDNPGSIKMKQLSIVITWFKYITHFATSYSRSKIQLIITVTNKYFIKYWEEKKIITDCWHDIMCLWKIINMKILVLLVNPFNVI